MIIFMWIPAHREIKGNEMVDGLAKQALEDEEIMNISLSKYEAKAIIKASIDISMQGEERLSSRTLSLIGQL